MTNLSKRFGKIKRGDVRAQAAFVGWHDARLGLPPRPEYVDHHDKGVLAAYHNYRLLVLEARTMGRKLPGWNSATQIPPAVTALKIEMAETAQAQDKTGAMLLSGSMTTRRPAHLVEADLRNSLLAANLGALAADIPVSQTY